MEETSVLPAASSPACAELASPAAVGGEAFTVAVRTDVRNDHPYAASDACSVQSNECPHPLGLDGAGTPVAPVWCVRNDNQARTHSATCEWIWVSSEPLDARSVASRGVGVLVSGLRVAPAGAAGRHRRATQSGGVHGRGAQMCFSGALPTQKVVLCGA